MGRVTESEIKRMNELYLIYHTYSAVAKEVGRSPGTVKRYIDPNFTIEEVELKPIDWHVLGAEPKVDFMEDSIDRWTCDAKYNPNIDAFYLDAHPTVKDRYIITNNFDQIPIPTLKVSYHVLEARLLNMDYEEYLVFCKECLGAEVLRQEGARYAATYFKDTIDVRKTLKLLNANFRKAYNEFILHD